MPLIRGFVASALTVFLLGTYHSSAYPAETVTVFAAASLKNALDEAAQPYERGSGNKIVVSYAASSALARQIENGAPVDIFISADLDWMDYLAGKKLLKRETRFNFLTNRLVLIAPSKSNIVVNITANFPLGQLLGNERLAMANPDSVPAGKYAKAALATLGVWNAVAAKVAPAENVRAALALVSRGECPLGIVYKTDALADKGVRVVAEFPANSHPAIVYPAAALASSRNMAAIEFLQYLRTPAAQTVFAKYGFPFGQ